jgi:class I fructose-bisphosphate aldolase
MNACTQSSVAITPSISVGTKWQTVTWVALASSTQEGSQARTIFKALSPPQSSTSAGGMGLISGRKAFQKPKDQGIEILNAIQSVYACAEIQVA